VVIMLALLASLVSGCAFDDDSEAHRFGRTTQAASVALGGGWFGTNLGGSEALGGTSSLDAGVFTVIGGGGDLWGYEDDGHFVYQPISGDFDFVARVTGYGGDTSSTWCKATVMFKEAVGGDGGEPTEQAAGVYQSLNHSTDDYWYVRDPAGFISSYNAYSINANAQGDWMRLTRTGNTFRSYHWDAGSTSWVQHGGDRVVALNTSGYLGMGATSAASGALMSVTFADVSLAGPAPDSVPPVISNINVVGTGTSATITWDTDENASSDVQFGTTAAYGSSATVAGSVTQHEVVLTGLTESTQYHFSVISQDASSNSSSSVDALFDSGVVPPTALPAGWQSINLGGSEAMSGSSSHTNGLFTLSGGGGDLWSFQDDGHFVYQTVTGDFELIAQVDGYAGDTSYAYAKAALMFKEDDGGGVPGMQSGSVYQSLNYAGSDYWYQRDSPGTSISSYNSASLNSTGGGAFLRLTRTGDVFRSYHWESASSSWVQHGGDRTAALSSNGFVGMAATSGTTGGLLSVQFSSVSVSGGTVGPDVTPPVISNVAVSQTDTAATITWTSNEPATSVVDYGTTAAYGSNVTGGGLVTSHSVQLSGLSASTQYHFQVGSADADTNAATSVDTTFTTQAEPDTTPPTISNVVVSVTDTTATILWDTDEPATSSADYGPTASYGSQATDATLATSHSLQLSGLSAATQYHFQLGSADAFANLALGSDATFTTDAVPPPAVTISNVVVSNITEHEADVSWNTDVPATTEIDYDLDDFAKSVTDGSLTTTHIVTIGRMMADEDHDFVITADDGSGGVASTALQTLTTAAYAGDSLPSGWDSIDIGPVSTALPGSATFDPLAGDGSFVVRGTGTDVFDAQDSFHFVYHPVAGDFQLTLKVEGWNGYLHQWSKAMTMFRADLDDDSQMFNQSVNNTGNDWLYYRDVKGAAHVEITNSQLNPGDGTAVWARLTRVGNTFTEEYSADGVSWQLHGPAGGTVVNLPATGYVGFGVCSKSNEYLSEIVYSNVDLIDNSVPDNTAPLMSSVQVASAGDSATITWTTDESATSVVDYGTSASYGSTETVAGVTLDHTVVLTGLTPNTEYHFDVTSADLANNSTSSGDIAFNSGDLPSFALPAAWSSIHLGNSGALGGEALYDNGVFQVSGSGGDLWSNQDDGHFVYQPISGDFELIVQVDGYTGDTSYTYSKAALVFKEDTGGGVPNATAAGIYQSLNYSSADYWYERAASGIASYNSAVLNSTGGSAMLRLTRTGDTFRSYSWDGVGWVQHGGDRVVALNATGYVGFAATSGTSAGVLTAQFSNVSFSGGTPAADTNAPVISNVGFLTDGDSATILWDTDEPATSEVDYGLDATYGQTASTAGLSTSHQVVLTGLSLDTVYHFSVRSADSSANQAVTANDSFNSGQPPSTALPSGWFQAALDNQNPGDAIFANDQFVISGRGGDFWGSADGGHVAYQPVTGDFELQATIVGYGGDTSQAYAKAVLLFKEEAGGGSMPTAAAAGVFQSVNYGAEDYWYQRDTVGGSVSSFSSSALNGVGGSVRLGLTRTGDTFRSFRWDEGTQSWIQIGADRVVALGTTGYVGMGVTSNTAQPMDVTFGDVTVTKEPADSVFIYAGTMDQSGGGVAPGEVVRYKVDRDNGSLFYMDSVPAGGGVRNIAVSPDKSLMYVLVEDGVMGYLRSFDIAADGSLTDLYNEIALGSVHTQVTVDATGAYAFAASFDSGEMVMVPLDGLGGFGAPQIFNPGPGAHQVRIHPNNDFLYVPTLYMETVAQYNLDASTGTLSANTPPTVGSSGAPRYMDFHPALDRAYVVHETGIVRTFSIDPSSGNLTYLSSVTTTDGQFANCSDFQVSADGQYAYAVNRSGGDMAVYSIDGVGDLTRIQNVGVGGFSSRSFAIDEAGDLLFVSQRQTKNIVTMVRDPSTGLLTQGSEVTTPDNIWYVGYLELP
jgi:6-phosphogluconolactonase (cycloisomerase 2 family)